MADLKITKTLTNNRFTVSPEIINETAQELSLLEDFGEPIVTLGGTIDVTSTSIPLTGVIAGTFTIGETIEAPLPTYSGATGVVQWVDTTGGIVYVKNTTGTFVAADVAEGASSGATITVSIVGAATTQFEARYNLAPESSSNFSVPLVTRRIPSQWDNGALVITFDGNSRPEAEENANDFIQTLKVLTTEAWAELTSKIDNYEGVDIIPLP